MKTKLVKQYELACKYGVDERVRFYRLLFGSGKVIDYLKKCINKEEKLLKKQDNFWSEGDIRIANKLFK